MTSGIQVIRNSKSAQIVPSLNKHLSFTFYLSGPRVKQGIKCFLSCSPAPEYHLVEFCSSTEERAVPFS